MLATIRDMVEELEELRQESTLVHEDHLRSRERYSGRPMVRAQTALPKGIGLVAGASICKEKARATHRLVP